MNPKLKQILDAQAANNKKLSALRQEAETLNNDINKFVTDEVIVWLKDKSCDLGCYMNNYSLRVEGKFATYQELEHVPVRSLFKDTPYENLIFVSPNGDVAIESFSPLELLDAISVFNLQVNTSGAYLDLKKQVEDITQDIERFNKELAAVKVLQNL